MKVAILVFPGTGGEQDCHYVLTEVFGLEAELVWHTETDLGRFDALILPGGASYGDYVRPGALAKFSPVMGSVIKAADSGTPILGIGNGFQILLEAGLLPGAMLVNESLLFYCGPQKVEVVKDRTPFTRGIAPGTLLDLPIAHGAGNYFIDEAGLAHLEANEQIVFRYAGSNPNGSVGAIAGVCNAAGNVVGLMPHPERAAEALLGSEDGQQIFKALINYWEAKK